MKIKDIVNSLDNCHNFDKLARKSLIENKYLSFFEGCNNTKHFNLILIGKTGTGKSTLINAVLGSERAETGIGECVTMKNKIYEGKGT